MIKRGEFSIALVILLVCFSSQSLVYSGSSFLPSVNRIQESSILTSAETIMPNWTYSVTADWTAATISGDGGTILSVNDDTVSLFDYSTNTPLWSYNTSASIYSQSLSDDGEKAVVGTLVNGQDVLLFSRMSNDTIWESSCDGWVIDVTISGDGSTIAAVDWDGNIYAYDSSSNESLWKYHSPDPMLSVAISEDGNTIVAGGTNNTIYVFDRSSNNTLWTYEMQDWVYGVDVSNSGNQIIASCSVSACTFNRTSNETVWEFNTNDLYSASISGDGSTVVVGSSATSFLPNLYVFSFQSNETLWTFNTTNQLRELGISDDGSRIIAGGYDNHTYLFTGDSNNTLLSLDCGGFVYGIGISKNGSSFTCGAFGTSWFYQIEQPTLSSTTTTNDVYSTTSKINVSTCLITGSAPASVALLFYSCDNSTWDSIVMTNQTPLERSEVNYNASIGPFDEGSVYYYVHINDTFAFNVRSSTYSISIDGTAPSIGIPLQTPLEPTSSDTVQVQVGVNDSISGIDAVFLLYSVDNGATWTALTMFQDGGGNYSCTIPTHVNGTIVQFTINATDNVGNVAFRDNSGVSYSYTVFDPLTPSNTGNGPTPSDTPTLLLIISSASALGVVVVVIIYLRYRSGREIIESSEDIASSEGFPISESTDLDGS